MYLSQSTLRNQGQNRAFELELLKNQEFQYHFSSVNWPKYIIFLSKYVSKIYPIYIETALKLWKSLTTLDMNTHTKYIKN